MDTFTIFAIDQNGNHFSEEYTANSRQDAIDLFHEEESGSRILFVVDGAPDFIQY